MEAYRKIYLKVLLTVILLGSLSLTAFNQCVWTQVDFEGFEYSTVAPDLISGTTYHSSPWSNGNQHSGSSYLYMNFVNNLPSGTMVYEKFYTVCPSKQYRFSAWLKGVNNSSNNITLNIVDGSGLVIDTWSGSTTSSAWFNFISNSITPTTPTISFQLMSDWATGNNDMAFDDLLLEQCVPIPLNKNLNICVNDPVINLYDSLSSPLSNSGVWSGPTALNNGFLGSYNPSSMPSGVYAYTITNGPNCPDSVGLVTIVNSVSSVNLGLDTAVCAGTSVLLDATIPLGTYLWQDNSTNPIFQATQSGMYWVDVTVNGCVSKDSINIQIHNLPNVVINASDTVLCEGDVLTLTSIGAVNYVWDNGVVNGISFSPANTNLYIVVGTDVNGCKDTNDINIVVNANPQITLSATDTILCEGESLTLTGSGANTYAWDNGVVNGVSFAPNTSNLYTAVGTDINGCKDTNDINIVVNPTPNVVANATKVLLCEGESLVLTGSGASSYVWDNGGVDGISFIPEITDTYTVTGVNQFSCENTGQIYIEVIPYQTVTIQGDQEMCIEPTLLEINDIFSSYLWQDGSTNKEFTVSKPGTYSIIVTDIYGCTYSAETEVISNCLPTLYIPNAFTPNGDGDNDVFSVKSDLIDQFEMAIYSRWGNLIYQTDNIYEGWRGESNTGSPSPEGAYVYQIKYSFFEGITKVNKSKTGTLILLR